MPATPPTPILETSSDVETDGTGAHWSRRVVVFVDVVESVRLMQQDEAGVIARWRLFVSQTRTQVLPVHGGRMVKSLGDGLLLDFHTVPEAVAAAHSLQRLIQTHNTDCPPEAALWLRMGVHTCQVVVDEFDIYGAGVNLCARIAATAQPGAVVVSAEVRALLLPALDGEVQDLGLCYLKHVQGTQRLFSLHPPKPGVLTTSCPADAASHEAGRSLRPKLAVAPVLCQGALQPGLAQTWADNLIAALSRSAHWTVTSRLSTAALGQRQLSPAALAALLGVQYLVCCTVKASTPGNRVQVLTEIIETATDQVIWQGAQPALLHRLLQPDDACLQQTVSDVAGALLRRQIDLTHHAALPTLAGYTLLLSAISSLHSLGPADMLASRAALEHLVDRHPRAPEAKVWLAKWHFLQLAQASAQNRDEEIARAKGLLSNALDDAPDNALALALSGHIVSFVDGDSKAAEHLLHKAVAAGPNEPMAALFLSQLQWYSGSGEVAVQTMARATELSPVDPMGYYFDLFAAGTHSAVGEHEKALVLVQRSLRQNCLHLPSWVQLIIEQMHTGRFDEARHNARHYLVMRPAASVQRFFDRHPARNLPLARAEADALLAAGLPN